MDAQKKITNTDLVTASYEHVASFFSLSLLPGFVNEIGK